MRSRTKDMNTAQRRTEILKLLHQAEKPVAARALAAQFGVSRQVIVQDMAVIRASTPGILSTTKGYVLQQDKDSACTREFKVRHGQEQAAEELNLIVDCGGRVKNISISHRVYGRVSAEMDIRSRQDVNEFVQAINSSHSTVLSSATSGYHYHLVEAASQERLDLIGEQLEKAGFLADRMSINLELPTANGLKQLAPCKSRHTILSPMRQIQNGITENQNELMVYRKAPKFVPAGQSTQMIIGATPENDYQIMRVSEALYEKFHLKRVFYSAFINVNGDSSLPVLPGGPPLLREHRLYQADWLLRYYRFHVDELLSEDRPNFNIYLDPKCDWALRHLDTFPVEINRASYQTLLRVPGIGYKSAQRIVAARRDTALTYDDLKKIGVVLKRALYFITCSGRMMYRTKLDEDYICSHLMADHTQVPTELRNSGYQQLSLFDTGLAL